MLTRARFECDHFEQNMNGNRTTGLNSGLTMGFVSKEKTRRTTRNGDSSPAKDKQEEVTSDAILCSNKWALEDTNIQVKEA